MGKQIIWNRVELEKRRPVMRDTLLPCCFVRKGMARVEHFICRQPRTIEQVVQGRGFDPFKLDGLLEPIDIEGVCIGRTLICPGRPLGIGCNFASSTARITIAGLAVDGPTVTAALVVAAARTVMHDPRMP